MWILKGLICKFFGHYIERGFGKETTWGCTWGSNHVVYFCPRCHRAFNDHLASKDIGHADIEGLRKGAKLNDISPY